MGQVIGEFLPLALGVAISPIPIIAVILMLFSGRAKQNSLAFMLGWVVGIVAAMAILIGVASTQRSLERRSTVGYVLVDQAHPRPVAGGRPRRVSGGSVRSPARIPTMPGWMTRSTRMGPGAAIGLGVLLSAVNPKNLLLIAAAAVTISQGDLSSTETAIVVGAFTLIGASTVAVPTLGYLFLGAKVQPKLDAAKVWLSANNTTVMAVLLLVIGVTLFGKGLGALL